MLNISLCGQAMKPDKENVGLLEVAQFVTFPPISFLLPYNLFMPRHSHCQGPRTTLLAYGRPLLLAMLLIVLPVRRVLAEDRADLTLGYYIEDHNRVEVWSPALLLETDINPHTVMRLQGIYDVVSGASPSGAPMTRKTRVVTKEIVTTQTSSVVTGFNTISGATGVPAIQVPISGTVTKSTKTLQTSIVPYGKPYLPMQGFDDQRLGLNLEFEHYAKDWIYTGGVAYGNESDYESLAGTVKLSRELNHKDTVISAGASFGHDWVLNPTLHEWDGKDTLESILSLAQVIDAKTLVTIAGTLGSSCGYLDDQYKYASVDDVIVHEKRPDARDKRIAMVMLNRAFDSLNGSVEASYRFYNDSYGIAAHTLGLAWYQRIGKYLVLAPSVRYYEQSAADFYGVKFAGQRPVFSSDYRLSKLDSVTYGVKLLVKLSESFDFTLAYDRYAMHGQDGETPGEAYPKANIFTAGFKLWY
ncbi:MAG: hypothetical protein JWO08_4033 [Verrucomicrobiaceae bacterium]|nr:hypothetical protein [Verrucomicrobiaceae bacterium]